LEYHIAFSGVNRKPDQSSGGAIFCIHKKQTGLESRVEEHVNDERPPIEGRATLRISGWTIVQSPRKRKTVVEV
jgi:hypothetical protein